jgi:hypothetical protein
MPNLALVEQVISLMPQASPSELVVLKMAASLIKQIDQDYEIEEDTDQRIRLTQQEMGWLPDTFEVSNAIVCPKHWGIPERLEAVERERAEIQEIMNQTGLDHYAAVDEYLRRRKQK